MGKLVLINILLLVYRTTADKQDICIDNEHALGSELGGKCMGPNIINTELSELMTSSFWTTFCNNSHAVERCLNQEFSQCGPVFVADLHNFAAKHLVQCQGCQLFSDPSTTKEMMTQVCDRNKVSPTVTKLFSKAENSLDPKLKQKITNCTVDWLTGKLYDRSSWTTSNKPDYKQSAITRYAHGVFKCVLNAAIHQCSSDTFPALMYAINWTMPTDMRPLFPLETIAKILNQGEQMSTERSSVGVIPDSHLLVYGINITSTCLTTGTLVYLSNPLVHITAIHSIPKSKQTPSLTQLHIEFLDSGRVIGRYRASEGLLPDTFYYGPYPQKLSPSDNPIEISLITDSEKVMINSTGRAIIILIQRRVDAYLFSVRLGKGVLESSSGLLVTGCHTEVQRGPGDSDTDNCYKICQGLHTPLGIDLTQTCNIDCSINQETQYDYAEITKSFIEDLKELRDFDSTLTLEEPVQELPDNKEGLISSAQAVASLPVLIVLVMTLCIYISRH